MDNFWQREWSKHFRRLGQDLRRRLQLLNPSPTAVTSSRCDDTFSPTSQPFEQHHSISLGSCVCENGIFIAGLGVAEIDVEDDAAGIL